METVRIRQPGALALQPIYDFLYEAFDSDVLVRDPAAALDELAQKLHLDALGLFIVGTFDDWRGMVLAQWSASAFNPACVMVHIYNRGDGEVRNALLQALVDYAREGGYDRIIGMDTNDRPQAFARLFSPAGEPEFAGQIVVFDMNESLL